MDWPLFVSVFSVIFLAELPDKTAIATLILAARGRPVAVFLGVATAFAVQSLMAVFFGNLFGQLPQRWVHIVSGLLFLGFAAWMWRAVDDGADGKKEIQIPPSFTKAALSAFLVIFIAEWGDLTQLATATFQARYHSGPTIFAASVLALWSVTLIGVWVGHTMKHVIPPKPLRIVGSVTFAATGIYFLLFA